MSFLDRISSVLLSFLLALFVFIVAICSVIRLTFCSPKFMVSVLDNQNYYNVIYDEYCEAIEQLAIPAGVAEGEFSKAVSKAEFENWVRINKRRITVNKAKTSRPTGGFSLFLFVFLRAQRG